MRRISTSTKVTDKFGAGKHGFTNGNAVGGIPATDLEDVFFDHVQEEIASPIEAAGLTLDVNDRAQLLAAIQILSAAVVGLGRNVKMSVTAASASATLTADQVVVATALGQKHYRLAGLNKSINLATTGAGGMDTGSAPVSGYVALYAIYNPATGASALLAKNATSAVQPEVYGGANMPAGYTASALVSVWPTNASGQFVVGWQLDRKIGLVSISVLNTATSQASPTSLSLSAAVPPNAVSWDGSCYVVAASGASAALVTSGSMSRIREQGSNYLAGSSSLNFSTALNRIPLITPQTTYYIASAGTNYQINCNGYEF